ncbi:MAG: aminotransferase class I/II-fold pyridoxal phosphate-dependent enzyme [Candidatus Aminicenantes bacterium]
MKIEHFKMERMQSKWENVVAYNLSESGVHPFIFEELMSEEEWKEILKTSLGYVQSNGTAELREKISQYYQGSNIENILVTTGSAEANFLLMWANIEPGDEVIFMKPNYMQIWGLMRGFDAHAKSFFLREDLGWNPDLSEIKKLVTKKTKMIVITNPNNPTGSQLSKEARKTLIELADKTGAWIFSDEVYQGAEMNGSITPSFWGEYDRVVVSCGLSKAYGLPGLRTGWMVAPEDFIQRIWPYHDYTTISITSVSDRLARIALDLENRKKILERTRNIIRTNFNVLESWFKKQDGLLTWIPPKAGAIVFPRYNLNVNSIELVNRLRESKDVLLVPGEHFEMDHYLRFGFGVEESYLKRALNLVQEGLDEIRNKKD